MTEKQKMLAGASYNGFDPDLLEERAHARQLTGLYNLTSQDAMASGKMQTRATLLRDLLGGVGERVWIEPPFHCDYGCNIFLEDGVYLNFNCIILDCNTVHIGEGTVIGPGVHIYAAYHPTDPQQRKLGPELAAPVHIGKNVWIGGGAIICPGVTIGDNTTIGAGSVVVKDVPANAVGAGNPCRVVRSL